MTYPRAHLIDPDEPGCYHLVSRCVRRAFLCGSDPISGTDFSYRQEWLERRMLDLAEHFALDVHAYAVMSNHYHVVIYTQPERAREWDAAEVARRWVRVLENPDRCLSAAECDARVRAIVEGPTERIDVLRERLKSVSWYMARINEPMARRCNEEDGCKGRFWEGRFHSGRMLDEPATLQSMVYADLNPVRAGVAKTLADSEHTGVARRLAEIEAAPESIGDAMRSLTIRADAPRAVLLSMSTRDYIALVQWTGENIVHPGKASLSTSTRQALEQLGICLDDWSDQVMANSRRRRAYGSRENIRRYAARIGRKWIRGAMGSSG